MASLIILLLCLLFSINVRCKSEYKIHVTRGLIPVQNTDYVNGSIWLSKISRYVNGINGLIDVRQDIPHEAKGIYSYANYTVDESILPPSLPFTNAMLEVGFWDQNKPIFVQQACVTFDRDKREKYTVVKQLEEIASTAEQNK
ncbi:hypothetical protein CBL_20045 [Carabus blaptoides fortunei]